jgi:hypothetical protein
MVLYFVGGVNDSSAVFKMQKKGQRLIKELKPGCLVADCLVILRF